MKNHDLATITIHVFERGDVPKRCIFAILELLLNGKVQVDEIVDFNNLFDGLNGNGALNESEGIFPEFLHHQDFIVEIDQLRGH